LFFGCAKSRSARDRVMRRRRKKRKRAGNMSKRVNLFGYPKKESN
jgi:hypothetical protein